MVIDQTNNLSGKTDLLQGLGVHCMMTHVYNGDHLSKVKL